MSFQSELQAALGELNAEIVSGSEESGYFLWKGVEVPCVGNQVETTNTLAIGGFLDGVAGVIYVIFEDWLTADSTLITADSTLFTMDNDQPVPVTGRKLTYRQREYRIRAVSRDAAAAYWKLVLMAVNG